MEEQLIVGEILKPQGIRGELKVKYLTDKPQDIQAAKEVIIDKIAYKILSFRTDGVAVYLGLRGVPDRNAAELFRGKLIYANRENLPALEEGRFYIVDLIGCSVVTQTGEMKGIVKEITSYSSNIYTLSRQGEKDIMFPAAKGVILSIEIENKKIIVDEKRFEEVAVV